MGISIISGFLCVCIAVINITFHFIPVLSGKNTSTYHAQLPGAEGSSYMSEKLLRLNYLNKFIFGNGINSHYGYKNNRLIMLLEIDQILSLKELTKVKIFADKNTVAQ